MISIADINTAIINQTWSNDQLTSMIDVNCTSVILWFSMPRTAVLSTAW
jgi:hypothetical protein